MLSIIRHAHSKWHLAQTPPWYYVMASREPSQVFGIVRSFPDIMTAFCISKTQLMEENKTVFFLKFTLKQ